jgi:hypothetical protein
VSVMPEGILLNTFWHHTMPCTNLRILIRLTSPVYYLNFMQSGRCYWGHTIAGAVTGQRR